MTTSVVIMAGGRGLRLHPLTNHRPKPLLKVGGKPILEQIIDGFTCQGFKKIWLCVNYMADLIEGHFGDGHRFDARIRYVHEEEPLGTGGALSLLPQWDVPFIVCNADVLCRIQYGVLMEHHARSNAEATVCLALHQHQIPYGVAEFEDERFIGLREKPIEGVLVNAGIYVLEPDVPRRMLPGPYDMPDLLKRLTRLSAYPIEGYWQDVGTFEHLARANTEWE